MVNDFQDAVNEQFGDIIVTSQNTSNKTVQHISAVDVVFIGVQQAGCVVNLGGKFHGLLNNNDVAGSGLGCVVDHIDHGLGFAGAFGANDQFNHKK